MQAETRYAIGSPATVPAFSPAQEDGHMRRTATQQTKLTAQHIPGAVGRCDWCKAWLGVFRLFGQEEAGEAIAVMYKAPA